MRTLLLLTLLLLSVDLRAQSAWRKLDSPTTEQLSAVQFFNAEHGYIAGRGGGFLRTNDGGNTWEQLGITSPHPFGVVEVLDMFFHDSLTGVVAGSHDTTNGIVPDPRATLFWTYDGGKTWDIQMFDEPGTIAFVQFLDRKFAYFATTRGLSFGRSTVYYTNSGGFRSDLWQKRTTFPSPERVRGMAFRDNATGILSGDDEFVIPANLYFTSDAGLSWDTFVGDHNGSSSTFDALHWNADGLLGTSASRIMHSLDSGKTWGTVASSVGSAYYQCFSFVDDLVGFAMPLFSGEVLKTTNGGFSWQMQQIPDAGFLSDLWAVDEETAYAVGPDGAIYKLGAAASVSSRSTEKPSLKCHPNPARTIVTIKALPADHDRIGSIVDMLGRGILAFDVDRNGSAELDVRTLIPGAYVVVVDGQAIMLTIE